MRRKEVQSLRRICAEFVAPLIRHKHFVTLPLDCQNYLQPFLSRGTQISFFGVYRRFYKDGSVWTEELFDNNGKKHGHSYTFYENGNVARDLIYEHGKCISFHKFHPDGSFDFVIHY